jgi:hypothetical protein
MNTTEPLVGLLMSNKQWFGHKILVTDLTQKWPMTCVRPSVDNQGRTLCKGLVTMLTCKWPFSCMCTLVNLHIKSWIECLPTCMTNIGFFTSVGTNMHLQIIFAWQHFTTNITDTLALPSMGLHVHQQNFLMWVTLTTDLTLMCFSRRFILCVMGLAMLIQLVLIAVHQTTHVTLKWFLPSVSHHVLLDFSVSVKPFHANNTLKLVLIQMSLPMICQVCFLNAWITTYITHVTFFPCMNLPVISQLKRSFKLPTTHITGIWSFITMYDHMHRHSTFWNKRFTTLSTGKWPFPSMDPSVNQ